jgi:hypothetical protein
VPGFDQREEDVVLAEEARGGRDAGQREQEDELLERGIKAGLSTAAKLRMAERNKR